MIKLPCDMIQVSRLRQIRWRKARFDDKFHARVALWIWGIIIIIILLLLCLVQEISDDLFEGDVVLDPDTIPEDKELYDLQQKKKNEASVKNGNKRQGTRNLKWLWHHKKVPYEILPSLCKIHWSDVADNTAKNLDSKTWVKYTMHPQWLKNWENRSNVLRKFTDFSVK